MVKCITVVHLLYSLYLHFLADGHLGFQYFAIMKNAVVSIAAGESHGQRSLAGYSLRGRKESDTTERLPYCVLCIGVSQNILLLVVYPHFLLSIITELLPSLVLSFYNFTCFGLHSYIVDSLKHTWLLY